MTSTVVGLVAIVLVLLVVVGVLRLLERRRPWRVVEITPDGAETVLLFGYRSERHAQAGAATLARLDRAARNGLRYAPRRLHGRRR